MADVSEPLVFRGVGGQDGALLAFDELQVVFSFREVRGEFQSTAVIESGQAGFVHAVIGIADAETGVGAFCLGKVHIAAFLAEIVNGFGVLSLFIGFYAQVVRFRRVSGCSGQRQGQYGGHHENGKLGDGFFNSLEHVLAFRVRQFFRRFRRLECPVVPELKDIFHFFILLGRWNIGFNKVAGGTQEFRGACLARSGSEPAEGSHAFPGREAFLPDFPDVADQSHSQQDDGGDVGQEIPPPVSRGGKGVHDGGGHEPVNIRHFSYRNGACRGRRGGSGTSGRRSSNG